MTPTQAGELFADIWTTTLGLSLSGYIVTKIIINDPYEEFELVSKENLQKVNRGCLTSIKIHMGMVGLMTVTLAVTQTLLFVHIH